MKLHLSHSRSAPYEACLPRPARKHTLVTDRLRLPSMALPACPCKPTSGIMPPSQSRPKTSSTSVPYPAPHERPRSTASSTTAASLASMFIPPPHRPPMPMIPPPRPPMPMIPPPRPPMPMIPPTRPPNPMIPPPIRPVTMLPATFAPPAISAPVPMISPPVRPASMAPPVPPASATASTRPSMAPAEPGSRSKFPTMAFGSPAGIEYIRVIFSHFCQDGRTMVEPNWTTVAGDLITKFQPECTSDKYQLGRRAKKTLLKWWGELKGRDPSITSGSGNGEAIHVTQLRQMCEFMEDSAKKAASAKEAAAQTTTHKNGFRHTAMPRMQNNPGYVMNQREVNQIKTSIGMPLPPSSAAASSSSANSSSPSNAQPTPKSPANVRRGKKRGAQASTRNVSGITDRVRARRDAVRQANVTPASSSSPAADSFLKDARDMMAVAISQMVGVPNLFGSFDAPLGQFGATFSAGSGNRNGMLQGATVTEELDDDEKSVEHDSETQGEGEKDDGESNEGSDNEYQGEVEANDDERD
ncbi:hypothetical protein BCR44DRAFT_1447844 [Catenaria anguillulae PL171]|uniref:Uncharacterized protein n=1 Tax=Catenaria anguillulae PL171 TaxID=765915 RepID=A0A1Y2H514_9FUNG|nr:hypothetical protein BCR44DRAFT_85055 [Catenaria anguillulae PL171]ORZ29780.1 hypothetical protein BCR44DRAFT_1447844 [Catenaria anguillulae PL171]